MTLKSFNLDDDTISLIKQVKDSMRLKSEKEVIVKAIRNLALSEMIEHESVEFKTLQKMNEIETQLKQLNSKMNHVDLGVSVNNCFLLLNLKSNGIREQLLIETLWTDTIFLKLKKKFKRGSA
ncbi:hypothetical protein [Salinicoccus roseus]|uniref:hypothetical protein n=1 Tax=Salinicoccus roseus TaxID=45670 RepID=UPI002300AB7C|nr:hypothetical protein [Salinicoccus roseus]